MKILLHDSKYYGTAHDILSMAVSMALIIKIPKRAYIAIITTISAIGRAFPFDSIAILSDGHSCIIINTCFYGVLFQRRFQEPFGNF